MRSAAFPSQGPSRMFNQIHELVTASLTGEATEEEFARLERLVREIPEARTLYVEYIFDSVGLSYLLSAPGKPQASAEVNQLDTQTPTGAHVRQPISRKSPQWFRDPLVAALLGCAAALAVGLLIGVGVVRNTSPRAPVKPALVGRLERSADATWLRDGHPISLREGDPLTEGEYRIKRGIAQIVFPWGATATFQGPSVFELGRRNKRRLLFGKLVVRVPWEAGGFTIEAPAVDVVDLGTEFALAVAEDGESEVHVFSGSVETRPATWAGNARPQSIPITLTARQAKRFSPSGGSPLPIAFNSGRFTQAWQIASGVAQATGQIRFAYPPLTSVLEGATESDESLVLFREREGAVLSQVTAVTITQPGLYTTFDERVEWLSAGLAVDSYLLHFDPVGSSQEQPPVVVAGSVTFDRPIVACIARGDQLAASDGDCACPSTRYIPPSRAPPEGPNTGEAAFIYFLRGLNGLWKENENNPFQRYPAPNDRLLLSQDRRTLCVRLTAGSEADQVRVLVSADPSGQMPDRAGSTVPVSRPFWGRPFRVGQKIEAEDFDRGGDGVAYYHSMPNALAVQYRPGEGIPVGRQDMDGQTKFFICRLRAGDWLAYTVDIEEEGLHIVKAAVTSVTGGGRFYLDFGQSRVIEPMEIPICEVHSSTVIQSAPQWLPAGTHTMRLIMDANHEEGWVGNIDWMRIERQEKESGSE